MGRGVRRRCPRCGRGRLFRAWYTLDDACHACGLTYESYEGNTWAFMYLSTAFLTGLILGAMLLITPEQVWKGRTIVVVAAVLAIIITLPWRKAVAVALDYYSDALWNPSATHFGQAREETPRSGEFDETPKSRRE